MLRKLGQGMRSGLSGRHGCAGLVQFLRIFSKGWCVPQAGRRACGPYGSAMDLPTLSSNALRFCTGFSFGC